MPITTDAKLRAFILKLNDMASTYRKNFSLPPDALVVFKIVGAKFFNDFAFIHVVNQENRLGTSFTAKRFWCTDTTMRYCLNLDHDNIANTNYSYHVVHTYSDHFGTLSMVTPMESEPQPYTVHYHTPLDDISPTRHRGDLIVHDGVVNTRFGIPAITGDYILTANNDLVLGVDWKSIAEIRDEIVQITDITLVSLQNLATVGLLERLGNDTIATVSLSAPGRTLISQASIPDIRGFLSLGNSAIRNIGSGAFEVASGHHTHSGVGVPAQPLNANLDGISVLTTDGLLRRNPDWTYSTIGITPTAEVLLTKDSLQSIRDYLELENAALAHIGFGSRDVAPGDHSHQLANLIEHDYASLAGRPPDDNFITLTEYAGISELDYLLFYRSFNNTYHKIRYSTLINTVGDLKFQPKSDLLARIAGVTTDGLLELADGYPRTIPLSLVTTSWLHCTNVTEQQVLLNLGNSAVRNVGTGPEDVAAGNHTHAGGGGGGIDNPILIALTNVTQPGLLEFVNNNFISTLPVTDFGRTLLLYNDGNTFRSELGIGLDPSLQSIADLANTSGLLYMENEDSVITVALTNYVRGLCASSSEEAYRDALGLGNLAVLDGTEFVRSLLTRTNAAEYRSALGLGDAAVTNVGTALGTVAAGNHDHGGVTTDPLITAIANVTSTGLLRINSSTEVSTITIGTLAGTIAAGDHTHGGGQVTLDPVLTAIADLTSTGVLSLNGSDTVSTLAIGTTAGTLAAGDHTHTGGGSGVSDPLLTNIIELTTVGLLSLNGDDVVSTMPIGIAEGTIAAGNHRHGDRVDGAQTYSDLLEDIAQLGIDDIGLLEKTAVGNVVARSISTYGKTLIDDVDAATARATLGLGNCATLNVETTWETSQQGTSGTVSPGNHLHDPRYVQRNQTFDSISTVSTAGILARTSAASPNNNVVILPYTSFGSSLINAANASSGRTNLGLGNSATLNTGTTSGTVATGNHDHDTVYEVIDSDIARVNVQSTWTATQTFDTASINMGGNEIQNSFLQGSAFSDRWRERVLAHGTVSSGTVDLDFNVATVHLVTVGGPITIRAINGPPTGYASALQLVLTNGGTNVTWDSAIRWSEGVEPDLSASGRDRISMISENGSGIFDAILIGVTFQ